MSVETTIFVFDPAAAPRCSTLPKTLHALRTASGVRRVFEGYQPLCHYHDTGLRTWVAASSRWRALEDDLDGATERLVATFIISPAEAAALGRFVAELDFTFDSSGRQKQRWAQQLDHAMTALGLAAGSWKRLRDQSLVALGAAELRVAIVASRLIKRDLDEGLIGKDLFSTYEAPFEALAQVTIDHSSILLQQTL